MPDQISGAQDKAFDQAPRLQIVGATNFFPRWDDRGSGGRHDFFSWRAKPPRGFHALGDLGVGHYYHATSDSQHLLVKAEDPDALRHPVRYDRVWGDWGSGANQDGSFWRPVPPAGYRALGLVCETGYAPPPLTTVVCVREEYLLPGELDTGSLLWNDADTGSDTDFACWQIVSQHVDGIVCGTFSGGASWTPPGWVPEAWVLNRLRVVLPAAASTDVSPGRSTNMIVAKEMIRFNKNGYPLDFHSIFGYPWQHQQAMLRLKDDAQGNRYYMGTYSQNVGGSEGGMVFVGRVPPGTSTGDVIWCDVLSDGHLAGGYNHPGDLRRIGDMVVIAGQNFAPATNNIPFIDKMNPGNGGQAVLFYDVSNSAAPMYAGRVRRFFSPQSGRFMSIDARGDGIDEISVQRHDNGSYRLSFNSVRNGTGHVTVEAPTLSASAVWRVVSEDTMGNSNPFVHGAHGTRYAADLHGRVIRYTAMWPGRAHIDSNPLPEIDLGDRVAFAFTTLPDGTSSAVFLHTRSDNIEIAEVMSQ